MKMKLGFLFFIVVQLSPSWSPLPTEGFVWRSNPTTASGIQGQSVSITWTGDLASGLTWEWVKVYQRIGAFKYPIIKEDKAAGRSVYDAYKNRDADLNLTASQSGTLLTSVFTMKNLNRSSDEHLYYLRIDYDTDSDDSADLQLTVLVPSTITSPNPKIVTVNESQTAQLECTVEGNPTPQVNWTRNGVIVGTGVYTTPVVGVNDDKTCYTCIAYNGVLDAKSANVCLNVQYQPRNATVLSDKLTVCRNSKVTLTCTSGPANPATSSYEFYNNNVLLGTSASNVYEATATAGLLAVNKFVCVPRNLLGGSLENGSVEVAAKVTPTVTQTLGNTHTVVEGTNVTLACTASGTPPLNVTWTRTGKPEVAGLEYPIIDIRRYDAGLYDCTVPNRAECPSNTATINVIVNYKPESTNLTYSPSNEKFCQGNQITLTCSAHAKPSAEYSLYRNDQLVQSGSTTGVFNVRLNEKGDNTFTCVPNNTVGAGQNKSIQVFVKVAPSIVTSPSSRAIVEGSTLTLFCNASGLPVPNITWTKVGGNIVGTTNTETYTIGSVTRGNEGTYRCTASNGDECSRVTADANVVVNYKPYLTNLTSTKSRACLNDTVTLECTTNANPPAHEYRFYLNDQLVHTSMSGVYQLNVPQAGNNTYKCEPLNTVGAGQDTSVTIGTKVSPMIVNTTPSQEVREGTSHTLYCNVVQGHGEYINVTWHKVGSGQVSSTGVYTIPYVTRADAGSYECRAHSGNGCEVKSSMIKIIVIAAPNISNIIVTGESLTITWSNLLLPHNKMATCWIHVMASFHGHGTNWVTSSNTSHGSLISCSVSGLRPSTLYHIQYALQIHKNHLNGTIYIGTSVKGASSNQSIYNSGVPLASFVAVIAVAVVVIAFLILVVLWMRYQGMQKNERIIRKEEKKTEVPLPTSKTNEPSFDTESVYENKGFISRQTERDVDLALYEQIQSRGLVIDQGVGGEPSFPMQNLPRGTGRLKRKDGVTLAENQVQSGQSQFEEPSYRSLEPREMEGARNIHANQGSYGHLKGFTGRLDNSTAASLQHQNPYQELQPENRSRHYQSLQNMQRPAFNV